MLRKTYSKTGQFCKVTFEIPPELNAQTACLCGEFNDWNPEAHPMKRRKDGRFSTTVSLKAGRAYRFRYILDGLHWENDWAADRYIPNSFSTEDSVVDI
jgi:1,4-alpha-glucan branching enzyme